MFSIARNKVFFFSKILATIRSDYTLIYRTVNRSLTFKYRCISCKWRFCGDQLFLTPLHVLMRRLPQHCFLPILKNNHCSFFIAVFLFCPIRLRHYFWYSRLYSPINQCPKLIDDTRFLEDGVLLPEVQRRAQYNISSKTSTIVLCGDKKLWEMPASWCRHRLPPSSFVVVYVAWSV